MKSRADQKDLPIATAANEDERSQPQLAPEIDKSLVQWFGTLDAEERLDYLSRQVRAIAELRRGLKR